MSKIHPWPSVSNWTPRRCREMRRRFGIQTLELAGRADVGWVALKRFEADSHGSRNREVTGAWRAQVCHAMRQLAWERCLDWARMYGAQIAADPKRDFYTEEAMRARQYEKWHMKPRGFVKKQMEARKAARGG